MHTKRVMAGLALMVGVSALGLLPAVAAAAPAATTVAHATPLAAPAFDASGVYQIFQSNGGNPTLNVTQDSAGDLFGSASLSTAAGPVVGTIENGAAVDGTNIFFVIDWSNGSRGRYTGALGPDRRLTGNTFALNNPASQATWVSARTF